MRTPVPRFRHPAHRPVRYEWQLEASRTRRAMLRPRALGVLSALLQLVRCLLEVRRSVENWEVPWDLPDWLVGL